MNIYVSLETAEKLGEAGWNRITQFGYHDFSKTLSYIDGPIMIRQMAYDSEYIPAPTAQEILEALPGVIGVHEDHGWKRATIEIQKVEGKGYLCGYVFKDGIKTTTYHTTAKESLVELLAELWLGCKKAGHFQKPYTKRFSCNSD